MDLKEIGRQDVDWVHLAQDRVCFEHDNETSGSIKDRELLTSSSTVSFLAPLILTYKHREEQMRRVLQQSINNQINQNHSAHQTDM
jgi:hypothetical protein